MKDGKLWKRCAAFVLALVFLFTDMAVNPEMLQAAQKQVKSVSLKIGSNNVTKKTVTMYSGDSKTLKVGASPKSAKKKVTFTSSKKSVATVNNKGVITAKKSGTAQIKVTVMSKNNKKKSTYVKVKVKYASLKLNKKTATLKVGKKLNLTAKVSPKRKVKWSSSNRKAATVSSKGVVKGVKAGTAKVTASVGSKKVSCQVKVTGSGNTSTEVKVQGLYATIEGGNTVYVGHSSPIITQIIPANATNKTLSYRSSNTAIAQVNDQGAILGISEGTAVITVMASGSVSTTLNVKVVEVPVESVKVSPGTVILPITGTTNLAAEILPAEASRKFVNWNSDNEAIARVDANGKVTGVSVGKTEIKAQVAGSSRFGVCTVEVVKDASVANGISMEVINPYKDNTGKVYENTVLFGRDMTLRVRLVRDRQPVGRANITLQLQPAAGNAEECFEIRQSNIETDSDGYANFSIGVKNSKWDAVCGKWQSFIVTARDSLSNNTAELSVRFATVRLSQIEVLSDIVPSQNASFADSGIYETVSTNGSKKVQYVTSQQVSSANEDHSVRLDAQPCLLLPATSGTASSGEWKITFPGEAGSGISGGYSIYNDDTNETTTTTVEEIPAGLNNLSVKFDKISLSKYTAIYMNLYNAETGELMEHREITASNNGAVATDSFGKLPDARGYLVISLVSQGQVEEGSEGYAIREISGGWTTENRQEAEVVELENAVKWETENPNFSIMKDLPVDAEQYIPSSMITGNYTYKYKTLVFPQVGNAMIEAAGPNNDGAKEYFVYPSVNAKSGSSYINDNVLAPARKAVKAVYLGKDDVTRQVGNLKQDGNIAVVDSRETGLTVVKATIAVEGLTDGELNSQNGGTLYSSIQWAPVPNKIPSEIVSDYYALEGQSVTITAQVIDSEGSSVAGDGIVTFQYNNGSEIVDINRQGQQLTNAGNDASTNYVTVSEITNETTDTNGRAVLKLRGINAGYVEGITAKCGKYNVKLTIGSDTKEEIKKANIYWVDMGLTYVNSAVETDNPLRTTNFASEVASVSASESLVGKKWKVGFLPVAKSHKFAYSNPTTVERPAEANEFISVSGISVGYSYEGAGSYSPNGNTAVLYSEQTGLTNLTGKINLPSDTSNVKFTFYDEDGNEVTHRNIGDSPSGSTAGNTGLKYQMLWQPNGEKLEIVEGTSESFSKDREAEIHVKVSDKYGNPISGAGIKYTFSGYHQDMGTQSGTTGSDGIVTITLPAPNVAGVSSTISVTAEKDKDLQASIIVTYTN